MTDSPLNALSQSYHPDIPDLRQVRRVLCVQPHYDDNDIGAGGTLAGLKAEGAQIFYLTVADDLVGVLDPHLADEDAAVCLKAEQRRAGEIIGVDQQFWLNYPDAGSYDYFELRRQIIKHIRWLRPDFVMTCDPWLPYEAHNDHILTGRAVAEASYLQAMPRLTVDAEIDRSYQPYQITGVAFYFTHLPNTFIDITAFREQKHGALDCYRAQFTLQDLEALHTILDQEEHLAAQGKPFSHAEAFKMLAPQHLHIGVHTWQM